MSSVSDMSDAMPVIPVAGSILLEIEDLHVDFSTREGLVRAIDGLDLTLYAGETLGLVGESGCGKSMTARAIMGLIPPPGKITGGTIRLHRRDGSAPPRRRAAGYEGHETVDLGTLDPDGEEIRGIRGREIGMVFQEPMTSFSPVHTIGNQIMEVVRIHQGSSHKEARAQAIEMLNLVGIPDAKRRVDAYSFELSGGMRQRAMIAMALVCRPRLLIADEPTTALDVTIQAQILELLQRLQQQLGMTILTITHNLGVVASTARRVAVMYMGRVVEEGTVTEIFDEPKHPYTRALLKSVPRVGNTRQRRLYAITGSVPDPYSRVGGCTFHPRCPQFIAGACDVRTPDRVTIDGTHSVSCLLHSDPKLSVTGAETPAGLRTGEGEPR